MPLFLNHKERLLFFLALLLVFATSSFIKYQNFLEIKEHNVYFTDAHIQKQYTKKKEHEYWVFKLKAEDGYTFYTTSREDLRLMIDRDIRIGFITRYLNFFDFIQGFFAPNVYIALHPQQKNIKTTIQKSIASQHDSKDLQEFFAAIFLGEPIGKELREKVTNLGIAHLIAISGYHLGVILAVIGAVFLPLYGFFHKRFFPYRNRWRDLFSFSMVLLSFYLYLVGFIPSLVRAFAMAVFGFFLASRNLRIVSFENLFWVALFLVALFPKLLFSIGFFLSLAGVFYIFVFIKFVQIQSKILYATTLSIYLFVVMTPVVFYFFPFASYYQALSIPITLGFSLFFPLEIILHIIGFGGVLDGYITKIIDLEIALFAAHVPKELFFAYLLLSLASIINRKVFYLLCGISFLYGCYLYALSSVV